MIADAYYFPPFTNTKLRSLPQVVTYLAKHPTEDLGAECFTFLRRSVFGPPHEIIRKAGRSARNSSSGCKGAPKLLPAAAQAPAADEAARDAIASCSSSELAAPIADDGAGMAVEAGAQVMAVVAAAAAAAPNLAESQVAAKPPQPAAQGEGELGEGASEGAAVLAELSSLTTAGSAAASEDGSCGQRSASAAMEPVEAAIPRGNGAALEPCSVSAGSAIEEAEAAATRAVGCEAALPQSEDCPVDARAPQRERTVPTNKRVLNEQKDGGGYASPCGTRKRFRASAEARCRAASYLASLRGAAAEPTTPGCSRPGQPRPGGAVSAAGSASRSESDTSVSCKSVQDATKPQYHRPSSEARLCSSITDDLRARLLRHKGHAALVIGPHHFARHSHDEPLRIDVHDLLHSSSGRSRSRSSSRSGSSSGGSSWSGGSGSGADSGSSCREAAKCDRAAATDAAGSATASSAAARTVVIPPSVLRRLSHSFPVILLFRDGEVVMEQEAEGVSVATLSTRTVPTAIAEVPWAVSRVMGGDHVGAQPVVDVVGDYCLLHVMAHLPAKSLLSASSVCRRWQSICRAPDLWQTLSLRGLHITDWSAALAFAQERGVKYITFDCSQTDECTMPATHSLVVPAAAPGNGGIVAARRASADLIYSTFPCELPTPVAGVQGEGGPNRRA